MRLLKRRHRGRYKRKINEIRNKIILKRDEKLNPRTLRNEFRLNQFITLRLIDFGNNYTSTYINIDDKFFNLYEFSFKEILEILNERSNYICMDETCLALMGTYDEKDYLEDPDTMFWIYCYYIAAWVEYDYDWRLLRVEDAFPMLHELYQAGDPKARVVFRNEIVKALLSGYLPAIYHLISSNYNYLDHFKFKEVIWLFEKCLNIVGFQNRKELISGIFYFLRDKGFQHFYNHNFKKSIQFLNEALKIYPDDILTLKELSEVYLKNHDYELARALLIYIIDLSNYKISSSDDIFFKKYYTKNYIVEAWRSLGKVYNQQFLFSKAIIAYNMAMNLDWKHVNTWDQIAIAYKGLGDVENIKAAKKSYKKKMKIVMKNEREGQW